MIEKILLKRIHSFLNKHSILSPSQYGFRKGFSTNLAVKNLFSHISNLHDNNRIVLSIFLDLSKAFDTVPHKLLLDKLYNIGFRGIIHDFISSFLTNRPCYVLFNDTASTSYNLCQGVPQGSIISPILYSLFVNDFSHFINRYHIMYADDTTILIDSDNIQTLQQQFQDTFYLVYNYFASNNLTINTTKTQLLITGYKHIPITTFHYNNNQFETIPTVKFLGINIDNTLSTHIQLQHIITKICPFFTLFSHIKHAVPIHIKHLIFQSLILPHIRFGLPFIFNSTLAQKKVLHQKITQLLKTLYNLPFNTSSNFVYSVTKIPTLEFFIHTSLIYYALDIIKNNLPPQLLHSVKHNSDHNLHLHKRTHMVSLRHCKFPKFNLVFQAMMAWNDTTLTEKYIFFD